MDGMKQALTLLTRQINSHSPLQSRLHSEGYDSDAALDQAIKKLEAAVTRARKKEQGVIEPDEPAVRRAIYSCLIPC
jgi:GTP cyclohydrolase II